METTLKAIPSESLSPNGNRNGNKLRPEDRPVHEWYRFVLSFPPHLVREYINRFGVRRGQTVLDPFCGTGTTLVECKKLGIESIGIEANPMACFASKVKLDWRINPTALLRHARSIAEEALARLHADGIGDELAPPLFRTSRNNPPKLLSLPEEPSKLPSEESKKEDNYEGLPF